MLFHHKPIKKFSLEGNILDDSLIVRLREEYVKLLTSQMRLSNCVPRIDIDPDITISYNQRKKIFTFKITIYGVNVGKENIECIRALNGAKPIYIQTTKSSESLQVAG